MEVCLLVGGLQAAGGRTAGRERDRTVTPSSRTPDLEIRPQRRSDEPPARACLGSLCLQEDEPGQRASGTSLLKAKAATSPGHSGTEQARGLGSWPRGEQTLTAEAAALDPGLPASASRL